jgi:hypothetical protein
MDRKSKNIRRYFASKLAKVHWKGYQGTARCPWHHDRRPSLSVNARTGLFYCHACGAKGGLVEFERRTSGCNLKTAQRRIAKLANRGGGSNIRGRIVAVYSYKDEKGRLRYQQVRFDPKDFRFRRPDGKGGWIWNLEGIEKILYRLPDVIPADTVYVPEGEKDVRTLKACGLIATCNPGGAGKWRQEYSRALKGKKVIVLQDDDAPGHKHAQAVADSIAPYAAEVRIIPPFPNAKDVTEWIEQGGTKRKLQKMVAHTPPIERIESLITLPEENPSLPANDWRANPLRGKWTVRLAEDMFQDYLVLPAGIPFVASLWTIATHIYEVFDYFPYFSVTSPTKRCGKSLFGEILGLLSARPLMSTNISEAAIFRSIASERPTLIIDEAESLRNRNSERAQYLLSILQAGFKQGSCVLRTVGRDFHVKKFPVYCPKVVLAIGHLPDTLMDRSLLVSMRRHLATETVARFRRREATDRAAGIVSAIMIWAEKNKEQVAKAYLQQKVDFLTDREADIWEPLFAIASVAVPERLNELKQIALRFSEEKAGLDVDDSEGLTLLADIRSVFEGRKDPSISSADLVTKLKSEAATNWSDELTQSKLARLLRPFGISPLQIWGDKRNYRGYRRGDFNSAFERYLPPEEC